MINREKTIDKIKTALGRSVIVSMLGPRQCGKTTLAKIIVSQINESHFFDLEHPSDIAKLQNPLLALEDLTGMIVLDEVQLMPELFPVLRVLADREKSSAQFLLLGSASPDIIKKSSETLAGRVEFVPISGFDLEEIKLKVNTLWIRGGFPKSFLAKTEADSFSWRENFVMTFLERDLGRFGVHVSPQTMRRFWTMLAHSHGNVWNASDISKSLNISYMTAKRYVDILSNAFMVRQLQPWFENISKRQVKSPKVYIRDSGILHYLLNIKTKNELLGNPKLGVSWEGFVIEQLIYLCGERNCYYWRTSAGAELDLLFLNGNEKIGFESKCTDTVKITKSIRIAIQDLNLRQLYVVYPGKDTYRIDEKIIAISISDLLTKLRNQFRKNN